MHPATLADALEALSSMEKGQPYSLRPVDPKRRLADDLARLGRELAVTPVVIGGLAVNQHGYMRLTPTSTSCSKGTGLHGGAARWLRTERPEDGSTPPCNVQWRKWPGGSVTLRSS